MDGFWDSQIVKSSVRSLAHFGLRTKKTSQRCSKVDRQIRQVKLNCLGQQPTFFCCWCHYPLADLKVADQTFQNLSCRRKFRCTDFFFICFCTRGFFLVPTIAESFGRAIEAVIIMLGVLLQHLLWSVLLINWTRLPLHDCLYHNFTVSKSVDPSWTLREICWSINSEALKIVKC